MKKRLLTAALVSVFALTGSAFAAGSHDHSHGDHEGESHGSHDMDHGSSDMFLVKKEVNGYEVSFHVMAAQEGMEHGGSHNLMVKIEEGGKAVPSVKINSKVIYPGGESDSKPLMKMGSWYMNGYDLGNAGKHQLMILFKTPDGEKHKSGVYYSVE